MSVRPLAVLIVAAVALPAAAAAQTGQGPSLPSMPGGMPMLPPPCADGQQPTADQPCIPLPAGGGPLQPCAEGTQPTPDAPCLPLDGPPGMPSGGPTGGTDGPPQFAGGFLSRVWRFTGDADSYDADTNVLNLTITKVLNLPKRFADQDDPLLDSDAYVLFSATTKVYDANGKRVFRETKYDGLLDAAQTVQVVGKIVPPQKWQEDQDGMPTPTLRAKKVIVTS